MAKIYDLSARRLQMNSEVPVVILCGGAGVRLREKTVAIPKPLVRVGSKPILIHVMNLFAHYGFTRFVLCLGYKGKLIENYIKHTKPAGWDVTLAHTGLKTPTGGRIKKVARYLTGANFMVTYADGVADIDIQELYAFHQKHGRDGTVTAVRPPSQFGELTLAKSGLVTGFREKPMLERWINGGFFVFKKKFLSHLNEDSTLERDPVMSLFRSRNLVAHRHRGFWKCMDTYKDFLELNELWSSGQATWQRKARAR